MSLRATSHGDLQALSLGKAPALDSGLSKSFSNMNSGGSGLRFSSSSGRDGVMEEITDLKPGLVPRRPIRAVRPVSAGGTILQINHLQGELVRKRKECEDLKKENKYLSNEIHMERIMMRTENELTMRNLRNLNHDLQAQVKELKQKLHFSQQRASMCSRAAEDAELKRGEAERVRALAEVRAMDSHKEMDIALDNSTKLTEELQQLKKEHNEVQLSLAKAEKSYFETKLKLDRVSSEKQALLGENRSLEEERDTLRHRLKEMTDDNAKIRDKEVGSRRRALAAEEESQRLSRAQQEAEQGRRLAERERDERTSESLSWREKHQALDSILRAQEDLKAQCRNKACQANIKSYFLCMTESDQRVKILKNSDGSPKNFTEGDPVYISTPEPASDDTETGSSSRTMFRVSAPRSGKDSGPSYFSDLSPMGADSPEPGIARRSRKKTVEYFWIPTDEE